MSRPTKRTQRVDAVALRLQFSDAERALICSCAQRVWDEIGYDVITMGDGKAKSVRRSVVIEVVSDAGRLEDAIRDANLRQRVRALTYAQVITLLTPAFPDQWYGL